MPTLSVLNAMPLPEAQEAFTRCCGATRWVEAMLRERPFRNESHLFESAWRIWAKLESKDWLEAFTHHPRIGEAAVQGSAEAKEWAQSEQATAQSASEAVKATLAAKNKEYEAKFGHVYLVCATGRSAEEILKFLEKRMGNDGPTELFVAAQEQEKITRIRLEKLLSA